MDVDDCPKSSRSGGLRRRSVGINATDSNLPLNLEVGFKISDGGVIKGTPSPSANRFFSNDDNQKPTSSLMEFRKKQQSFEIHIEDCDEEELSGGSSDEGEAGTPTVSRPHTPAHMLQYPDYSGNITYKEQPTSENFLRVGERDQECLTDVSEGESENEDGEDDRNMPESVIKRVPTYEN